MTVKLTSGLNLPSFFWRTKSQTLLDENVRWKKDTLRAFYGILHACLLGRREHDCLVVPYRAWLVPRYALSPYQFIHIQIE